MRLQVRVTPRARRPSIEAHPGGTLVVHVTAPAEGGRANEAVRELLAAYFKVPKRAVTITQGLASRRKLVDVAR